MTFSDKEINEMEFNQQKIEIKKEWNLLKYIILSILYVIFGILVFILIDTLIYAYYNGFT